MKKKMNETTKKSIKKFLKSFLIFSVSVIVLQASYTNTILIKTIAIITLSIAKFIAFYIIVVYAMNVLLYISKKISDHREKRGKNLKLDIEKIQSKVNKFIQDASEFIRNYSIFDFNRK